MISNESVNMWLANYVEAWKSYDPEAIRSLFSQDARYYFSPYSDPVEGCEAIVADWLKNPDKPGTFQAEYKLLAMNGNLAVANGRTTYFKEDGKTFLKEFDNIFVLEFDETGKCSLFKEWYMKKPDSKD